jgi:NAD(P)-dependent dehydrogenase (short-subunit alcohol dehydrogenase family)
MSLLDRFTLEGKTAIVTGATSGIGKRTATAFAEVGATVYAVARRAELLDELADHDGRIVPLPADLLDEAACEQVVARVLEQTAQVDILVNNAGASNIARAEDETTTDFHRVVDLNLTAAFILARDVGRAMIERETSGSIVNVSSVAGVVGVGSPLPQASYAAAKAGCIGLTHELAAQWARRGIRVNALVPGWVDTEMTSEWIATDKGRETVARQALLRRAADVDEIACGALYLASDASSYVTGSVLTIDGGWSAV